MGTADLLAAFNLVGDGKVTAARCRLRYDHSAGPNMQILEFDGLAGEKPFAIISVPFLAGANPIDRAREMADYLLKGLG